MEAASAASAQPSVSPLTKCSGSPAPPLAMMGMWVARETACVRAQSNPSCTPSVFMEASDSERSAAGEIAAEMGGLPLALELAAAFIEQSQVSLAEYLKVYKTSGASLRARTSEGSDRGSLSGTFALAFDKLTWPAKEILQTCAF